MKNPSIALSKMTTFNCSSDSIAEIISLSCGIVLGPKMFTGGLFKVTRQSAGDSLVRKTSLLLIYNYFLFNTTHRVGYSFDVGLHLLSCNPFTRCFCLYVQNGFI